MQAEQVSCDRVEMDEKLSIEARVHLAGAAARKISVGYHKFDNDAPSQTSLTLSRTQAAFDPPTPAPLQIPLFWSTATHCPPRRPYGALQARHPVVPAAKHVEHSGEQATQAEVTESRNAPGGQVVKAVAAPEVLDEVVLAEGAVRAAMA